MLNVFTKGMQLLFEQIKQMYLLVELFINETDTDKLKELERSLIKTYYFYLNIL